MRCREGDAAARLGDAAGETETGDVGCFAVFFARDDGDLFSPAKASRASRKSRFGFRAGSAGFAFASAAPYTFPWRELATSGAAEVLLSTHMDTVPPHLPHREDDAAFWGRGACDAKGCAASMIAAGDRLRADGREGGGARWARPFNRDDVNSSVP